MAHRLFLGTLTPPEPPASPRAPLGVSVYRRTSSPRLQSRGLVARVAPPMVGRTRIPQPIRVVAAQLAKRRGAGAGRAILVPLPHTTASGEPDHLVGFICNVGTMMGRR